MFSYIVSNDRFRLVRATLFCKVIACADGFFPRKIYRITEDACGDEREADGPAAIIPSKVQRLIKGAAEEFTLSGMTAGPAGTDCMNDVFRIQLKGIRNHRFAGRAITDLVAGLLQLRMTRCPENRTANAAAGLETFIGGVDNGVGTNIGNTGFFDFSFFCLPFLPRNATWVPWA